APELVVRIRDHGAEQERALLQATRDAHRPPGVAEVPLQLTDDRRNGIRGKLHATVEFEAVDRLKESHACDLDQIVERLSAASESPRQVLDEGKKDTDEDRKSTRLNSSHLGISYAVFCS